VALGCIAGVSVTATRLTDGDVRVEPVLLSRSPGVVIRPAAPHTPGPVAFLVHGFGCNRSMMVPLAKHLARRGVTSYAIDLPGHGGSPLLYSHRAASDEVWSALAEVASRETVSPEQVLLVGHSYGAALLAQTVAPRADVVVFLGPSYFGGLASLAPRAMLVLTAEHDHSWIANATREMMADVGKSEAVSSSERAWRVAPGADHIGLVFDEGVYGEVLRFIERSKGFHPAEGSPRWPSPLVAQVAAAFALGAFLATALLVAAFVRERIGAPQRRAPPSAALRTGLVFAYACIAGVIVSSRWVPADAVRLVEGGPLASLLVAIGIAGCVLDVALCRGGHLLDRRDPSGLPIGLVLFAVAYASAALTIDGRLYSTALGREHAALAGRLFACLLPFFVFAEGVLASFIGSVSKVVGPIAVCALYGAVALAVPFAFHDARFVRFVPVLLTAGGASILAGSAIRSVTRTRSASAVFFAACSAWLFAIGFARY
jgi:pimeloyl-ACP methyl ester carboxylesterase